MRGSAGTAPRRGPALGERPPWQAPLHVTASPSSRGRARGRRAGPGARRRRSRSTGRRRYRRRRGTRRRARSPGPSSPAQPCAAPYLSELRVQRQDQRPARMPGEVEVVAEVSEDGDLLPDGGSGIRPPVRRRVEALPVEEVVLDELQVRVVAQGLVVDVAPL